jgi:hypothetical protein
MLLRLRGVMLRPLWLESKSSVDEDEGRGVDATEAETITAEAKLK